MHLLLGAFEFDVRLGTSDNPASIRAHFCALADKDGCSSRWGVFH
jgi:hypothetical protein